MRYVLQQGYEFEHQYHFGSHDGFQQAIDWCYEHFGDDPGDVRWTYVYARVIRIRQPGDALMFWMRFG
jgi:hypothetical protein